ncbi:MAG: transposase, partial [Deltaproteobacteria bacterium]|nr:transposase [Deltaproteobacteria bacterium]
TDREAVEQIKENPYLQYFLGFSEFKHNEIYKDVWLDKVKFRSGEFFNGKK